MGIRPVRALMALGVALVHVGVLGLLVCWAPLPSSMRLDASSSDSWIVTFPPPPSLKTGDVPLPVLHLSSPHPTQPTLVNVTFEDPDADIVPGVTAATSAPHPDPADRIDETLFALRAGLMTGESVTIVLRVDVLPDGSIGDVSVQSSSGNPAADLEALALARARRWIPGTLHQHAVAMRIQYVVTLTAPA